MKDLFWPKELVVFDGYLELLHGEINLANGFGRIWIQPSGNRLPQEFNIKLGPNVLHLKANSQSIGTKLSSFLDSDKGWVAKVSYGQNNEVRLILYGISQVHKAQDSNLKFRTSIDGLDHHSFNADLCVRDVWTGRELVLLRYDVQSNSTFVIGDQSIGKIEISGEVPEVVGLYPQGHWGSNGRWLLLDRKPLGSGGPSWDESSILFLTSLSNSMSDFMAAWKQYNDAEERDLLEIRTRVGVLQYGRLVKIVEGVDFTLIQVTVNNVASASENLGVLKERVESRGGLVLEITEQKPMNDINDRRTRTEDIRVDVERVDSLSGTIQFRLPRSNQEVPASGHLFVSVHGDLAQINRRKDAESRFAGGQCELKGLSEILRETPLVESRKRRRETGVSSKMRAQFSGELTERQLKAIDIAINTPDIALIQGPPGTGKTQVIALIEQRLAELAENGRDEALILLTSTQNDAVDQVAARTRIFGLPPNRDSGRGDIDPIEVWRKERLSSVYSLLDSDAEHNKVKRVKSIVSKIGLDHMKPDDQFAVLTDLETFTTNASLRQIVIDARKGIQRIPLKRSSVSRIERRLRSIRTTFHSYEDDGRDRLVDVMKLFEYSDLPKEWVDNYLHHVNYMLLEDRNLWNECRELQEAMLDSFFNIVDERPKPFARDIRIAARNIEKEVERDTYPKKPGSVLSMGEALEMYVNEISSVTDVDEIVRGYTVVHAATCQRSAKYLDRSLKNSPAGFQNVIVDEAARVNPTDLLMPLVQAKKRVILVGDHRQLPAIFDEDIARGVSEVRLLEMSLFERLFVLLQRVGQNTGIPRTVTLNTQYRMHPRLGKFVSENFYEPYGESLENGLAEDQFHHQIGGWESRTTAWVDVPLERGDAERSPSRSWFREVEAVEVAAVASRIVIENPDTSVGIITFYSAQKELILEHLDTNLVSRDEFGSPHVAEQYSIQLDDSGKAYERLRVGSVDAFQGKEFDVVILSMVRSQKITSTDNAINLYGFAAVENRMCVALSRQKRLLIVVGDKAMASSNAAREITGLHNLVKLCDEEEQAFISGVSK